jgi:hypothetical protein
MANQIGADFKEHVEAIHHVRGNEVVWGGYNMRMWNGPYSPLYNTDENMNVIAHGRYEEGDKPGQFEVGDLIFATKNYQAPVEKQPGDCNTYRGTKSMTIDGLTC